MHRHRHAGEQRPAGNVTALGHVAPERLGAGGQEHVVDRGPEHVLDELAVLERSGGERDRAARGERVVEERAGGIEGPGHQRGVVVTEHRLAQPTDRRGGPTEGPEHPKGVHGPRHDGVGHQPQRRRQASGVERNRFGTRRTGFGGQVDQVRHQVGPGHAVDRDVVHLGHERDPVALDALDDHHVPQRPGLVERLGGVVADEQRQVRHPTGGAEPVAVQVRVEVEVRVVDHHRVVDAERYPQQPVPEHRDQVQPLHHVVTEALEAVAALHRGRIQDHHPADVHVHDGVLHVEERGVGALQP